MEQVIKIKDAPWLLDKGCMELFHIFKELGFEIRTVGGCVRDSLLNIDVNDWDLCTNMLPQMMMEKLPDFGWHVHPTGIAHGTITAVKYYSVYEITTLRQDINPDGRRSEVVWSNDWQQDALRRDFSINALMGNNVGEVIDYTNGLQDLKDKKIKFIGTAKNRIIEDNLRILRYYRFLAKFGFFHNLDFNSIKACEENGYLLKNVANERIYQELQKLFTSKFRIDTCEIMQQHNIWQYLSLDFDINNHEQLQFLSEQEALYNLPYDHLRYIFVYTGFCMDKVKKVARILKLSNDEKKQLKYYHEAIDIYENNASKPKQDIIKLWLYKYSSVDIKELIVLLHSKYTQAAIFKDISYQELTPNPFPIKGKDLLTMGFDSNKFLGEIMKKLEKDYIDSNFTLTYEQLMAEAKKFL